MVETELDADGLLGLESLAILLGRGLSQKALLLLDLVLGAVLHHQLEEVAR